MARTRQDLAPPTVFAKLLWLLLVACLFTACRRSPASGPFCFLFPADGAAPRPFWQGGVAGTCPGPRRWLAGRFRMLPFGLRAPVSPVPAVSCSKPVVCRRGPGPPKAGRPLPAPAGQASNADRLAAVTPSLHRGTARTGQVGHSSLGCRSAAVWVVVPATTLLERLHRRVGPPRAGYDGLRAHVDQTEARNVQAFGSGRGYPRDGARALG